MPEADPKHAFGIRPDPARAGALLGRLDDRDIAVALVDLAEVVAGQRHVPDLVRRRDRDAVSAAARRLPALLLAGLGIDIAVHAVLAGEPVDAVLVEHAGVEIGRRQMRRQHEVVEFLGLGIVADVGVQAAVGDPGRAVGRHDHAMRRGTRADRNVLVLAGGRVEAAEIALHLSGVIDRAVGRRRNVMGPRACGHRKGADARVGQGGCGKSGRRHGRNQKPDHANHLPFGAALLFDPCGPTPTAVNYSAASRPGGFRQRSAAASSASLASTQAAPDLLSTCFQNGARVFR